MDGMLVVWGLGLLAAARVSHLLVEDTLLLEARQWLASRRDRALVHSGIGERGWPRRRAWLWLKVTQLVECQWCLGFWVAVAVAGVVWPLSSAAVVLGVPWWLGWPALALAYSHVIGWGATLWHRANGD